MKPLFIKKNGTVSKVSGIIMNLIPSYTLAEYNALTHKPLLWIRTDEEYAQIPSEDVSYGSGSVKDALDGLQVYYKQHSIAGVSLNQSENGWHYGVVENVVPQGYEIISVSFGVAYSCSVVATAIGGVHVMLQSKEISTIPSNRYLRVCYTKVTSV